MPMCADLRAGTGDSIVKRTQYIERESGELLSENEKMVSSQFDVRGYLFWSRKKGARMFHDSILPKELTFTEQGQITHLAHNLDPISNMLIKRGQSSRNSPMTRNDLEKILKLKERQLRTLINKSKRLGVIAEVKTVVDKKKISEFYLNPIYFHSSSRISVELYEIFSESLDEVLPLWAKIKFREKVREMKDEHN